MCMSVRVKESVIFIIEEIHESVDDEKKRFVFKEIVLVDSERLHNELRLMLANEAC